MGSSGKISICEEVWEKGPIVSKYCFEKNAFKFHKYLVKDPIIIL